MARYRPVLVCSTHHPVIATAVLMNAVGCAAVPAAADTRTTLLSLPPAAGENHKLQLCTKHIDPKSYLCCSSILLVSVELLVKELLGTHITWLDLAALAGAVVQSAGSTEVLRIALHEVRGEDRCPFCCMIDIIRAPFVRRVLAIGCACASRAYNSVVVDGD